MSIRQRIFLGIILLFSVGFYFLIDIIADDIEMRYRESTEEPLVDSARILAALAASSSDNNKINIDLFRNSLEDVQTQTFSAQIFGLEKKQVDLHVYMTNRNGIVIFDSNNAKDEGQDYSDWRDVYLTLRGQYGARASDIDNDPNKKMIYVASPILRDNDIIGVLSVGKPTNSSNQFAQAAENKLIIGGSLACLILIAIALLLGVWVTHPIQKLTLYAKAIGDGKRVKRPDLGSVEMEALGLAFEQMRDALDGKQYVENYVQTLTHEIKSPISAIRGSVELLGESLSTQQKQTLLQNIHQESDRISQVVDNLLLLSSLESRKYISTSDKIAIEELIDEINMALRPLLLVKNLILVIENNSNGYMTGECNLIRLALMNIMQNAIDFSPSGSSIELSITENDSNIAFQVRDYGTGIPDYAHKRIFERFYSLKRPGSGRKSSGLGLSLVQEIVLLHGGEILISSATPTGTRVKIKLPLLQTH